MVFPSTHLGVTCELDLAGTWTDVTGYALQDGTPLTAFTITRGRQDESVTAAVPQTLAVNFANTDGRFSPRNPTGPYYGQLTRNTVTRVSVPDSGTYLRLADDAVSYASTPDAAGLQITGPIDIRIDLDLDNWVPSVLCGKWSGARAWALSLNADGSVTLTWFDGTNVNQVSCTGLAVIPLGRSMIRATLDTTTGNVTFYTAATMSGAQTQLAAIAGTAATSIAAAAGQAVFVGDSSTFDGTFGTQGCQGKIYEFRLYSGIGGTLEANPVFSSQTAGATSFTDAQSNTWTVHGTAALSNRAYRFHGEISAIPQAWDVTGHDVTAPVTASGMLRRIQQGSVPVKSVMRRGIQSWPSEPSASATGLSTPLSTVAYWPCEDNSGATSVAAGLPFNCDGVVIPPMLISGVASFQNTAGSVSADSVFACSAALGQPQSSTWMGTVPAYSTQCDSWSVQFLLAIPSGGVGVNATLLRISCLAPSNFVTFDVAYNTAASGTLQLGGSYSTSTVTGVNGNAYWVQVLYVSSGTPAVTLTLLPLGIGASATSLSGTPAAALIPGSVVVNPAAASLSGVEIGHIWLTAYSSSGGVQHAAPNLAGTKAYNMLNAWSGEAAATRFARLCSENSLASRVYGYPAVSAAMGPQQIDTIANILQSCEDADRGQIFESRNALALGYRTLASLCNQTAQFTLDFTLDEVAPPLAPTDDDQQLHNDAVITRSGGSSAQVQVTTGTLSVNAPPNGAGDYQTSQTVYCLSDTQLPQIAGWITHIGTADYERFPQVGVDLASTDTAIQNLIPLVRYADIGAYFTLANVPGAWLPPDPPRQLLWGMTERLGDFGWLITLNGVPEVPYETAIAGSSAANSAHADTDGTTLQAGVGSAVTLLTVATTNQQSPVWTTNTADLPFDIRAAGERMTVTNIDGAPANFLSGNNAGFDSGAGNWVAGANDSVAQTTAQAHSGAGSLQVTSTAAGTMSFSSCGAGSILTQGMACTAGDTIAVGGWFLAATAGRTCQPGAGFYTAGGALISTLFSTGAADVTTGWTKITGTVTAPGTAAFCRLTSQVLSTGAGGEVHYFDDAYLADVTTGGTSQTFTVTRSVNGVTKSQASGAAIALWNTPFAALSGAFGLT